MENELTRALEHFIERMGGCTLLAIGGSDEIGFARAEYMLLGRKYSARAWRNEVRFTALDGPEQGRNEVVMTVDDLLAGFWRQAS